MWSSTADDILETIEQESEDDYLPSPKRSKHKKQPWTEKNMLEALNCCKNQELGVEEASLIYGIPKRSLRSRLKERNLSAIDEKYRVFLLPGFPLQAELELVEYLQGLRQSQCTYTSVEVRRLAYELASEKYQLSNLPLEKDCLLGNRWYQSFTAKYPHLEAEYAVSCDDSFHRFFDALEALVADNEVDHGRMFSVHGIELKFRASNAYDFDKLYHRRKIIYTDAKAICCISAAGEFAPPVFIKPGTNGTERIIGQPVPFNRDSELQGHTVEVDEGAFTQAEFPQDCRALPTAEEVASIKNQIKAHMNRKPEPSTEENEEELRENLYEQFNKLRSRAPPSKGESGWNLVTPEIFHQWFRTFIGHAKPNCQMKIILLLAEQNHLKLLKTLQLAKSNGVLFLVLPPRSVHKIHPLDGFTMSLNRNLSTCASVWLGRNPDFRIQEVPLYELFRTAYENTVNPSIAKNGFTYSGIWPVNRTIFDSKELGGESLLLKNRTATDIGSCNSLTERIGPPDKESAIDVSKLCRICMKEKMYMKPLFDSAMTNYYGKKISEIVGRQISPSDGLPQFICQYCLVQLKDMVKIKNVAVESDKKMRESLDGFFYDESEKILLQYEITKQATSRAEEKYLSKGLDSLCRICMGEKSLMSSIFSMSQPSSKNCTDLSTRISEVSNCQVLVEDGLSGSICAFCRTSINQAWDFIRKVLESDKRFQEILSLGDG